MQDPFDADQRDALRSTDELLDRIGARTPTPEDLDDPIVAALALMAGEIDLDAIPVESTRAALEQAFPEFRSGLREAVDLRDPDPFVVGVLTSRPPGVDHAPREDALRVPRRSRRRPEHAAVALAPPRSLPRAVPPGDRLVRRPEGHPARRLHPVTVLVAAVAAVILGSGVTAAVTGGRSVNPLIGVQRVVAQLTNGRTIEQQDLYSMDLRRIDAARSYAKQGNRSEAVRQLNRINTYGLADEDASHVLAEMKLVLGLLGDG